ncbi:sugar ABC transporter permease [Paenibacillus hemerocallicola]|uniref:Sugar ABC transporter permease n=1 Tax=Paenibacillus hemerocallicola TaxID=1172614 RepID=A0A5C4TC77_9BACL|nr:ABC transporter permease subunit [Paenibacillus hemerocallicola]TNJ66087.1 sugar ABC transporter permease [Paenibacillus hemerocallicola]
MIPGIVKSIRSNWQLYVFIAPALLLIIVFKYVPIYGVQIAFKKFTISHGFTGGDWNNFANFIRFFNTFNFWTIIKNTFTLSLTKLVVEFPLPILLAILLNQVYRNGFRKLVQTVTYMPHLISMVVTVGMVSILLSPSSGVVNKIMGMFGKEPVNFLGEPGWFLPIYIISELWQDVGFEAILYIAALASIDVQQVEAAVIDGASKLQRILYIDIPSIAPTIIILLVLKIGKMMEIGFEKILLMQNAMNLEVSEIISTYVYKAGILEGQYGFAAAVGLMNSIINVALLVIANRTARRMSGTSLY